VKAVESAKRLKAKEDKKKEEKKLRRWLSSEFDRNTRGLISLLFLISSCLCSSKMLLMMTFMFGKFMSSP
jgi:hypothetical protein